MSDAHHHEHHGHDWRSELLALRRAAAHYYRHQFDFHGHRPPDGWDGPRYYPPAERWRLVARLDHDVPGAGQVVKLATSTGQLRDMTVAGELVFEASGERRLMAYLSYDAQGSEELFVPFRDETSGTETYGAGRYLEVPYEPGQDEFELDFNDAYNPSCAYSPAYDCPYPPPGNRLSIAVTAGEKLPFEDDAAH
jgi:uncharacterized protein (DUF1684 family)